ncbi:hypothetical protein [Novosphingobium soli]|uniref:DUF3325 domain-containing protein n=1 Tax=Novosphingobium soli TaxID=574956 RepID=A0ABV6CZL1_9SPHN
MLAWLGACLVAAGALALYLAAPHQVLVAPGGPRRSFGWAGVALLVLGLVALLNWAGPATAVFIAFTFASLVWTLVPLLAAWLRHRGATDQ